MNNMAGWLRITCYERDEHFALAKDTGGIEPISGLTDPDGEYGTPLVFTEWARKDSDEPLLRDYRYPNEDGSGSGPDAAPCKHYFYVGSNGA